MIKQLKKTGVLLTMLVLMLQACNLKDKFKNDNPIATNQVTASIIGVVKDELGQAIPNTTVMIGTNTVMSDANGIYIFNKIDCNQKATTVRCSKQGYFNGFKTLSVQANEKHIANVSLMKKENPQTLNTQTGGTVNSGNGIMITFPANALVNKNTGAVYNGQANVFIKKIDPTTELGQKTMPGNLTGLNTNSQEMLLQSFGMLAAEIEDNNGNPLQIATGKEATISSEIPASLVAQAKSTIPLWYFDETKMQWIEEGSATLNGTKYEGNVKHFSFWNCDLPNPMISGELILVDQFNNPLQNYSVEMTMLNQLYSIHGNTNSSGWIGGPLPANVTLTLNVYANNICGNIPIYTQIVNTNNSNINLGTIIISNTTSSCIITGTVLNCNNLPSTNSTIFIPELEAFVSPNTTGQFNYSMPCTPTSLLTFITFDLATNNYSTTTGFLTVGNNNLGFLQSCNSLPIFMNLEVKNTNTNQTQNYNFIAPAKPVAIGVDYTMSQNNFILFAGDTNYTPTSSGLLLFTLNNTLGTHNASGDNEFYFANAPFSEQTYTLDTINSTVTYTNIMPYPGTVEGSINLKLTGYPSGNNYTAIGTFRAIRGN